MLCWPLLITLSGPVCPRYLCVISSFSSASFDYLCLVSCRTPILKPKHSTAMDKWITLQQKEEASWIYLRIAWMQQWDEKAHYPSIESCIGNLITKRSEKKTKDAALYFLLSSYIFIIYFYIWFRELLLLSTLRKYDAIFPQRKCE